MQVYLDIFIIWRRLLEYVIIFFYRRHHREWGGYKDILALGEDMSCHTNEEERDLCMSCNNHAPCSVCFTHPLGSLFSIFFLSPSQLSIWWSAFLLSLYIEIQRRKVWGGGWCSQLFRRSSLRSYSQYSRHLFLCDVIHAAWARGRYT